VVGEETLQRFLGEVECSANVGIKRVLEILRSQLSISVSWILLAVDIAQDMQSALSYCILT